MYSISSVKLATTAVERTPYTDFLSQLDSTNIDPGFGNANDLTKTPLRGLLQANTNLVSKILDEATNSLNSVTIDRLAKIAFAFTPDTLNEYAKRAIRILGNALPEAGQQAVFHIKARLEQIDSNAARDAIEQAKDRPTFISRGVLQNIETEETLRMLSEFRKEPQLPNQEPIDISELTGEQPKSAAELLADDRVKMLHDFRFERGTH